MPPSPSEREHATITTSMDSPDHLTTMSDKSKGTVVKEEQEGVEEVGRLMAIKRGFNRQPLYEKVAA